MHGHNQGIVRNVSARASSSGTECQKAAPLTVWDHPPIGQCDWVLGREAPAWDLLWSPAKRLLESERAMPQVRPQS